MEEKVCDFCLKSQQEVLVMFSSRNDKFHVCDFCVENMFHELMDYFRKAKENARS